LSSPRFEYVDGSFFNARELCSTPREYAKLNPRSVKSHATRQRRSANAAACAASALIYLAACTPDKTVQADLLVNADSVSPVIVDNRSPKYGPGAFWRIQPEPLMTTAAGASGGDAPLDIPSAYRLADGRVILGDGGLFGSHRIMTYSSEGRLLATFGRRGDGPCEFMQLWWIAAYRGDSIAAFDYARSSVTIFDRRGRCGRSVKLPAWSAHPPAGTTGFSDGADGVFDDGSFLAYPNGVVDISAGPGFTWYKHLLLRVHPGGATWDTLGSFNLTQARWDGTRQHHVPFAATAQKVTGGAFFYFADGATNTIQQFTRLGGEGLTIKWNTPHRETGATELELYREDYIRRASRGDALHEPLTRQRVDILLQGQLPAATLPVTRSIVADAVHNIWAQEYGTAARALGVDMAGDDLWNVFDPVGEWLGAVAIPSRLRVTDIGDDYVLGVWEDEMGVQSVRQYRLVKPPRGGS
jgi:hypothetical protein